MCRPSLSVFGEEEEEDKPKRKLIKLQYTEEEQRAMEAAQKQVRGQAFSSPSALDSTGLCLDDM